MIAHLKPYRQYKKTGQMWLGDVPVHWQVLPNRAIFEEIKQRDNHGEEMLSVTITRGIIRQKVLLSESSKKDSSNKDKSAYKLVCPNDIAYNKMRAWQGAIGVSKFRGIVSPAYVVIRLRKKQNAKYFHYLFRTPHFAKEAERWSYGITSDMWSLRPEHFRMIFTAVPTLDEQDSIVRFLDFASQRIERTIRAKRKLINLLNEQRQTIIRHAVTRGLDPNIPMRDSGVDWIGEIPAHWSCRKMKYVASLVGGMTPSKNNEKFWNGSIPWVSPKDMKVEIITDSKNHISKSALDQTSITLIPSPAVLIVVRGMILARTFPTAITHVPVTINQDMKALKVKPIVNPDYLVTLLTGSKRELLNLVEEAGHGTKCLRTDSWAAFKIPIPPLEEQEEILSQVNLETTIINTAIDRTEREINFLREYYTRLITDVVTGQLDVSEAAQNLPEDEDELFNLTEEPGEEESELEEEILSED